MEHKEMLDSLFGSPAPQTLKGKWEQKKTAVYVIGGIVFIAVSVIIIAKYKSTSTKNKPDEKTPNENLDAS
ncbi:MAG TPA: hypothetical protein PKI01_10270 [Bacteroidales bacterium]|nr:hypothetical protein [Bacteroidales bacterium]